MTKSPIIVWFRRDFRFSDHEALNAAQSSGRPVIPVFILDEVFESLGAASKWRLGLAIGHFKEKLKAIGSDLILRRGDPLKILLEIMVESNASDVFWSRAYDPASIDRDTKVKANLNGTSFTGHLLFEPWVPKTKNGENFKVYTPFWRHVRSELVIGSVQPSITKLNSPDTWPKSDNLTNWNMGQKMHRGRKIVSNFVNVGEQAAYDKLIKFIESDIDGYKINRDFPMRNATSGLSENLTYGEISPRLVYNITQAAFEKGVLGSEHFLKELVWREFAYHLLWHFPKLDKQCWRSNWENFPWKGQNEEAWAWMQGRTGQSFVDAGMRELYVTGTMHNRLRMIVGSYLTKNLQTDWRVGLKWFEDCLIDWDPASNAMGWQWIAGCGPDAAPYFRIFNPNLQAEKFDSDQGYRKKWLEVENDGDANTFFDAIPVAWKLSADKMTNKESVDLALSRKRALDAYALFKEQ